MRIAVDLSPLSHPRTGIGNYLRGMVRGLLEAARPGDEIVPFAPTSLWGRQWVEEALGDAGAHVRVVTLPFAHVWRTAWSRLGRPPVERFLGAVDVLHFSDWMYPPQRAGVRATTVHDLVPLRFRHWVTRRTYAMHTAKYENAARTCDVVFANSRYTREDVVAMLGVPRGRVPVAYPGVDPAFRPDGPRADLGGPYVLSVSTLEPRKNLGTLIEAFTLLRASRPEQTLAVVGLEGWGVEARRDDEGVRFLGYVSDEYLAALYRGASAFVYASRFEGFGIPAIEAMACGVPSVVSAHPSLDEASGEAAIRADPTDPAAFASALDEALGDSQARVERGLVHAGRFTWRACGEAMIAGYESARS